MKHCVPRQKHAKKADQAQTGSSLPLDFVARICFIFSTKTNIQECDGERWLQRLRVPFSQCIQTPGVYTHSHTHNTLPTPPRSMCTSPPEVPLISRPPVLTETVTGEINSESTLLWKLNLQEGELGRGRELSMSSGPSSAQLLLLCWNRHYTSEISWSWLGRGRVFPAARKQTLQAAPVLCMCACTAAHNPVPPLTCTCTPTNSEKRGRECMIFLILKGNVTP